jgi:type III restriction enzyme
MGRLSSNRMEDVFRTCAPALADLMKEPDEPQLTLPFGETPEVAASVMDAFVSPKDLESLPSRYRKAVEHAVTLYQFTETKENMSFAPAFTSLLGPLDEAARGLLLHFLLSDVPTSPADQLSYFEPYFGNLPKKDVIWLRSISNNLKRTLIYRNGLMPLGLLGFCLDYGRKEEYAIGGVFKSVRGKFSRFSDVGLYKMVDDIKEFRNTYVAHQEKELTDKKKACSELKIWITGLIQVYRLHHP